MIKEQKIKTCLKILENPRIDNDEKEYLDISDKIFFFNKYDLKIPYWVYEIILTCCGGPRTYHLSIVIFDELMNSISARKFGYREIPPDYIITPDDWTECYEDGYPILLDNDDMVNQYDDSFAHIISVASRSELIDYIHYLVSYENRRSLIEILHQISMKYIQKYLSNEN